ncbi:O-antigen ligase family protein [Patescibacteria group bacterium]|nr:O-antigen ligase family protein [Patescibacteria group bacterium]
MKKEIKEIINLENFVGAILALLPLYLIKFVFWGMPLNLLEIMILLTLIWWLWEKRFNNPEWENFLKDNKLFFSLIGVILAGVLLSTFFDNSWKIGLGIIKGWFVLPLILALISADIFCDKKAQALKFFYAGAVGVAALALFSYIFGQITYDGRLQGIFNSPNYLAMYLVPAVIIGVIFFSENRKKYALSLFFIFLAIYLTYSFTAWVAMLIILSGLFFLSGRGKKLFVGFLILAGLVFLLQVKTDKLNNLLSLDARSSLTSRSMIWKSAGKIITDNSVWGIGPGNFQEKYLEYQKYFLPYLEWAVPHPHNLYLAFYLYSGIIGLVAFFWLMFLWIRKIISQKKEAVALIALGIIIYFLLHGILDTTYFKNDLAVIFWLAFWLPL